MKRDLQQFDKTGIKSILILMFTGTVNFTNAQPRPGSALWLAVQIPVNFNQHLQWHNDAGYRTLGVSADALQYLYRTGVRYHFNNKLSTAGGVAFFFTKTDFNKTNHEFGKEFRFWEEINYQQPFNEKLQILLRVRTEQRFFAATGRKEKYGAHRFRVRPAINGKLNSKWSLQLANELMQQAANNNFSFDQNRVIASAFYHFDKTAQLQAGYMWLIWPDTHQHILTITFTKTISLHDD